MIFTGNEEYDFVLKIACYYVISAGGLSTVFTAGYGKFADDRFGVELDPRLGWFLMELPATLVFNYFFWTSSGAFEPMRLFFGLLFIKHYLNRGFYFPLTIQLHKKDEKQTFSISVVAVGVFFTSIHGYLNARWIGEICPWLNNDWIHSPLFYLGYPLYELFYWLTIYHEQIVKKLRADKTGPKYKIPYGGLFEYVTNATYFCELMCWFGWALSTWSPAGLIIFSISCCNLIPRAFKQQKWYHQKFDNYPKDRKVIIPLVI